MYRIGFDRAPLLAAFCLGLTACHQGDRAGPTAPEEPGVFAKAGSSSVGSVCTEGTQRIAFSVVGDDERIYTINPDGTGLFVVPGTDRGGDPAWSPDRKKLAYVIRTGANQGLYVATADGKQHTRIHIGRAMGPAWSPDGTKIAFQSNDGGNFIMVINADGTNLQTAAAFGLNTGPTWSSDGTRLAWKGQRSDGAGIWVLHIPTGKRSLVVSCTGCVSPRFSPVPGDDRIAYSTYTSSGGGFISGIRIVNGDGSNMRTILYSSAHGPNNLMPSWSPDGERLVFISAALGGHHLVSARTNGSDARIVAKLPGEEISPAWGR